VRTAKALLLCFADDMFHGRILEMWKLDITTRVPLLCTDFRGDVVRNVKATLCTTLELCRFKRLETRTNEDKLVLLLCDPFLGDVMRNKSVTTYSVVFLWRTFEGLESESSKIVPLLRVLSRGDVIRWLFYSAAVPLSGHYGLC
jgi:hypothetical protein